MFYFGKNITASATDFLQPLTADQLVALIQATGTELAQHTTRLRRVAQLDKKTYQDLKRSLPYFIATTFRDNLRHSDNFLEINAFIIDFDNCLKTPAQSQQLLAQLHQQPDVLLSFISPNGSGIKVVIALAEPLTDINLYKQFYLDYVRTFADRLHLLGTLDTRTSDATRVCFIAHDPNVHYNPHATPVNWPLWAAQQYISEEDPLHSQEVSNTLLKPQLTPEIHRELLLKVNPKAPVKPRTEPHIPEFLRQLQQPLQHYLQDHQLTVSEIKPLPYGLKLVCTAFPSVGEVSIFYGKRGFSVVKSAKTSTNETLNQQLYDLVYHYLFRTLPHAT